MPELQKRRPIRQARVRNLKNVKVRVSKHARDARVPSMRNPAEEIIKSDRTARTAETGVFGDICDDHGAFRQRLAAADGIRLYGKVNLTDPPASV